MRQEPYNGGIQKGTPPDHREALAVVMRQNGEVWDRTLEVIADFDERLWRVIDTIGAWWKPDLRSQSREAASPGLFLLQEECADASAAKSFVSARMGSLVNICAEVLYSLSPKLDAALHYIECLLAGWSEDCADSAAYSDQVIV